MLNDDDLMLQTLLNGKGLAQMPGFQVGDALRKGTLVSCLDPFAPDDRGHYVCYLSRRQLPKRVRVFIDFITAQVRALYLDCATEMAHINANAASEAGVRPNGAEVVAWRERD